MAHIDGGAREKKIETRKRAIATTEKNHQNVRTNNSIAVDIVSIGLADETCLRLLGLNAEFNSNLSKKSSD